VFNLQGFYCNTYQNTKQDFIPLTVGFEKAYQTRVAGKSYDKEEMKKQVQKSSAVYADDEYCNFKSMLKLTRNGTFTVPQSRSLENDLEVHLGRYETVVEL